MAANVRSAPDRRHIVGSGILLSVLATLALGGLSDRAEASGAPPASAAAR